MTRKEMNERLEALEVLRGRLMHDGNTVLKVLPLDPACDVIKVVTLSGNRIIVFVEMYRYEADINWYSYIFGSLKVN